MKPQPEAAEARVLDAHLATAAAQAAYTAAYTAAVPYPHCVFHPLCPDPVLEAVADEITTNLTVRHVRPTRACTPPGRPAAREFT
jgi:hypothetical protein